MMARLASAVAVAVPNELSLQFVDPRGDRGIGDGLRTTRDAR